MSSAVQRGWGLIGTVPVLLATAWLLVGLPLLMLGALRPFPAVLLAVPVAAALLAAVLPRLPRGSTPCRSTSLWPLVLTVLPSGAFGVLAALTHSEHVVVRRDAGAYAQVSYWLATHGRLPIPGRLDAFGGADPALVTASPAFYADGGALVPQFMSGLPLTLVIGHWVGGWTGALVLPAVIAALALLAAGALTARLVGPWWAPFAVISLGLAQPMLHVAGGTYSEPLAQLFFLGGLYLLTEALPEPGPEPGGAARHGGRVLAGLAGLVLGLALVVRIDAGRELALLIPVVGWLYVRRRAEATPLVAGLLAGAGYGIVDGAVVTLPYLRELQPSLVPMVALLVLAAAGTAVAVPLLRVRREPLSAARWWRPVPHLAAGAVMLAGLFFAARPLLQTVRGNASAPARAYVASMQRSLGLLEDGDRLYSEDSLHWLSWYLGWPLLVLAGCGAAVLVWRLLRGSAGAGSAGSAGTGRDGDRVWVPTLLVVLGSTALTLWRPGITPDHPWADRRFVPVILPGLVLLALFAVACAARRAPAVGQGRPVIVMAGTLALVVPAAGASAPLLTTRTEMGEVAALERACGTFGPRDVVLLVDDRGTNEWPQALRGVCGVPTASVPGADPATISRLVARARAAGSRPVLAAGGESPAPLAALGATPRQAVRLITYQDQQLLTERPWRTERIVISLWTAPPPR